MIFFNSIVSNSLSLNMLPFTMARFKKGKDVSSSSKINLPFYFLQSQSKFASLAIVILEIISSYIDPKSYLILISTCKQLRELSKNEQISNNYILDYVRVMKLVFEDRKNVFITGSAGCGKTYILNQVILRGKCMGLNMAATATTGLASTNLVDGRTIHSFSGLRKGTIPIEALITSLDNGTIRPPKVWNDTDILAIDEISMNGSRFLQKLDIVAKHRRDPLRAMGGLQVVASGDFLQLKPVADSFPFTSDIWKEMNFEVVHLKYPFRQSQDMKFYRLLQRIRKGEPSEYDIQWLKDKHQYTVENMKQIEEREIRPTRFKSKQKDVQLINTTEFNKLTTNIEHTFSAENVVMERYYQDGKYRYTETNRITLTKALEDLKGRAEHQAPSVIQFREGAQYMLTFNFNVKKKHVNGSRCVYKSGGILEFLDGSTMRLEEVMHVFTYNIGNNLFVFRKQVAVRLAYACTIHSSQGLTVDLSMIDLGNSVFDMGQAYVALSRVRSSDGLFIENFVEKSIKTSSTAKEFMMEAELLERKLRGLNLNK